MIRVLILTDTPSVWLAKICNEHSKFRVIKNNDACEVITDMFVFVIRKTSRGIDIKNDFDISISDMVLCEYKDLDVSHTIKMMLHNDIIHTDDSLTRREK